MDFPLENIPFGVFTSEKFRKNQIGTRIGDYVISLAYLNELGVFANTSFSHETLMLFQQVCYQKNFILI